MKKIDLIDIGVLLIVAGAWLYFGPPVALITAGTILLCLNLLLRR